MQYPNIYTLFCQRVNQYSEENVFYVRRDNHWQGITWQELHEHVHAFASALMAMGLKQGSSVCILMGNVIEWPISDLGTITAGGISVGLYPTSSAEQCKYIINHSDAELVVVDTPYQLEKILTIRKEIPKVKAIVALDTTSLAANGEVISYRDFLAMGRDQLATDYRGLVAQASAASAEEIAIMVYTSGTTGLPKGACLSHRYVLKNVESLLTVIPLRHEDVSFSYLPYCHVAERIAGFYNRLYAAAPAYFVDDLTKLWQYMLEVKPTIFGSLPRFFEKIHTRIVADFEKVVGEEKELFQQVLSLGREISQLRQSGTSIPLALQHNYDTLAPAVLDKIKAYFGGRIRLLTSGGAPLPLEIAEFFAALSLPILQAYGLTENICVAFNPPDHYRFGTVGVAMPGCELKIAEDKEILIRSEMMFSGYYKERDKTAEIFQDGWLMTGDLGEISHDGFLSITGRKKELIITSTGKNISPVLIENLLKEHHLISQAMVYGDGRSYLVALITLNQVETEEYAQRCQLHYENFAQLISMQEIVCLVEKIVAAVNERLSSTEAIKKFILLPHDLSIEADEITPTMKLKRSVVNQRYNDLLESLYH